MANEENNTNERIARLDTPQSDGSQGYWADAWGRLVQNRLAVLGLIIILLNLALAIFAPLVAVEGIDDQNTEEANAAPAWVIDLFPILTPRDEVFDAGDGEIIVRTGQDVTAGELLIDYSSANLNAPVAGTVFVDARRIYLVPDTVEIPRFTIPSSTNRNSLPSNFDDVVAGDTLFGNTTASISGTVYIVGDELIIQPQNKWRISGEVQVENLQTVSAGDVILTTEEGVDVTTELPGTIFVTRNNVELALIEPIRITVPEDSPILIRDGREVTAGDVLFDTTTAPITGDAFIVENEIIIRQTEQWIQTDSGVSVVSGQMVEADELIVDLSNLNVYANMDGTVFVDGNDVLLTPITPQRYELPDNAALSVEEGQPIRAGDTLFNGVSSAVDGVVYILDDELIVRESSTGYVPLRNKYPLGADYLGRDLWSRIAYGARVSLLAAFIGPLVSFIVGMPYGLISGYFGGAVDNWMMRFVDLMYAFPTLLLIILLMAFFRSSAASTQPGSFIYQMGQLDRATGGVFFIFLGIGLTSWMRLARLTRGQVLQAREQEYVLAARALGQSTPSIMMRHILPNILGPIIISETLTIPTYIRFEAFLSFIGLGVNAPTPSWGNMISDGAAVLRNYPHEALFPALALFLIMFAFNFLGDGLRDALDPRLRGTD